MRPGSNNFAYITKPTLIPDTRQIYKWVKETIDTARRDTYYCETETNPNFEILLRDLFH